MREWVGVDLGWVWMDGIDSIRRVCQLLLLRVGIQGGL